MQKLRLGIIGAGTIGRLHAKNISLYIPEAEVLMVADAIEKAAQSCAREFGIPTAVTDYHKVLNNEAIEAILICTPGSTHATIIREAAEKGKHIFCEKPLGLDLKEIDDALAAVEKAGVKLQVGFNRRFDPSIHKAKELIAQGAIGRIYLVRITSRDPDIPSLEYLKTCGGLFFDTTIHDFDMVRYLTGDEVEELYASGSVLIDPELQKVGDIDTAIVMLQFKSSTLGIIENSRRAVYGYDQRLEVFGEKGMISVGNRPRDLVSLSDSNGVHFSPNVFFFPDRYPEAFVAELRAFVKSVKKDTEPPVTGHDGRMAVVMAYAAKRSFEERRPVRLAEITDKKKGGTDESSSASWGK
ncbi:MAG: inositol 2-dehydrogenase [Methanomassiliicoccales archaeon]|nr:inositol 2-dehydrogenase [Methanomassiliicoccales archaeon]